jgi:hypothetical protein
MIESSITQPARANNGEVRVTGYGAQLAKAPWSKDRRIHRGRVMDISDKSNLAEKGGKPDPENAAFPAILLFKVLPLESGRLMIF